MRWAAAWLALCVWLLSLPTAPQADPVRVATFNVELVRQGPDLLLRDIQRGTDPQIAAVLEVILEIGPDVLALQGIDWDYDNRALNALAAALRDRGLDYPHLFSCQPNSGRATRQDMDGDGRTGGPADAQSFGAFTGQAGSAVLSRYPIDIKQVQDLTPLLWRELPGALLPTYPDGAPFPSVAALASQRLSSAAHWILPIRLPDAQGFHLMTFRAGPPVFDGPEDRNGRRNHDEIALWGHVLAGRVGQAPPGPFVIAGAATLDPFDSDGRNEAIRALLSHPMLQDTRPVSAGAAAAADQGHVGRNALDTVDWPPPGPGRLRVDYVLPSRHWRVTDSGVHWPVPPQDAVALTASRHRLVWVDLVLSAAP